MQSNSFTERKETSIASGILGEIGVKIVGEFKIILNGEN
jgi:hypothetical protein